MPSRVRDFFEARREWSARKHEVFSHYAPQFSRILGRKWPTVYLVDGFAGAGYYGEGEQRVAGSPIQAAQVAQQLRSQAKNPYDIRCINVEYDANLFADLQQNTATYSSFVENRRGSFASQVDDILDCVCSSAALFFLDPFFAGLEWDTLQKIAGRNERTGTEMLINFNVPKFYRTAGWLDSVERSAPAFVQLLNGIMGSDRAYARVKSGRSRGTLLG